MDTVPQAILKQAQSLPEGGVLSPKEFLHLGSRAAIDQAFSRLSKEGKLLRVARGAYVAPVYSRFGARAPSSEKVIQALGEQNGEVVVPHGASSANVLGLTRQVPIREVYLTSGKTRQLTLGHSTILVKHAPRWMMALGSRPAGAAVRALAWMGPTHVSKSLATLRRTLPSSEWQTLTNARAGLPGWMAQAIGKEAMHG
ncbi:type IV toxin-antitoxin system AbiEi family antitoxin domain-containing protein [Alcaligenaceae bacterium]|nr:type IV toxin-antitoxin system AbiEi family antitoxin domain-containing protein [Alcaligenaceae bacterium]